MAKKTAKQAGTPKSGPKPEPRQKNNGWVILAAFLLVGGLGLAVVESTNTGGTNGQDAGHDAQRAATPAPGTIAKSPAIAALPDAQARAWIAEHVTITPTSDTAPMGGFDGLGYARLTFTFPGGPSLAPLFEKIQADPNQNDMSQKDPAQAVVLTVSVAIGADEPFEDLPLLILAPGISATSGMETVFAAPYSQTPFVRLNGAEAIRISLNVAWLPAVDRSGVNQLAAGAGDVIEALEVAPTRWPPRAEAAVREGSAAFGQLLSAMQTRVIRGIVDAQLGLNGTTLPAGLDLEFSDQTGKPITRAEIRLDVRRSLFGDVVLANLGYREIMDVRVGAAGTLGDHFAALSDQVAVFMQERDPTEALAACKVLRDELLNTLGLHDLDAALVVNAVAHARAVFAGVSWPLKDCIGDHGWRRLRAAAVVPPDMHDIRHSVSVMNTKLNRLAAVLKSAEPSKAAEGAEDAFADAVVLEDRSGFWLLEDAGLTALSPVGKIHPAASPAMAAARLSELPAQHFGCYHQGLERDTAGGSAESSRAAQRARATLVALTGDDGLWALEAAFDASGAVAGLQFRPSDQAEFCRATGSSGDTPNTCVFATLKREWRGIDKSRCRQ